MKTVIFLFFLSMSVLLSSTYDLNDAKAKVDFIENASLIDNEHSTIAKLETLPEFSSFQTYCQLHWSDILDDFSAIATNEERRQIVNLGFNPMAASTFVQVLEKVANLYNTDSLSLTETESILFPDERLGQFLVDNYSHPRIVTLLNIVKNKAPIGDFKARVTNVLSGTPKTLLDEFRDAHSGLPEEGDPPIILSP